MTAPASPHLPGPAPALRASLLAWYHASRRSLPWRESPSLYSTVVSEFMLQQTQVKTALPFFTRWLRQLPDFIALSKASEAEVLHLWEGLGYYTRAKNLHRLAKILAPLEEIPSAQAFWLTLPGIGPYSSAAITSIAFGSQAACVDGNVIRILARWCAVDTVFKDNASAVKYFTPLAQELLNPENPGDHNQAMMELGATLCTRQNPQCLLCPIAPHCKSLQRGTPAAFPLLAQKQTTKLTTPRLWSLNNDGLLLQKGERSARRLAQLHELPSLDLLQLPPSLLNTLPLLGTLIRSITRFRITEPIFEAPADLPLQGASLIRIPLNRLSSVTCSGPHRRWINAHIDAKKLH